MVQALVIALVAVLAGGLVYAMAAARVVKQYERGVVLRLGRLHDEVRSPGFTMIVPGVDRLRKVNMQIVTMPVPAQDGITRDNVTVRVDAVIYFKVVDAASAVIQVEDYRFAVSQMAQTSLRSIIGKSDLDDLLSDREKLNQGLELMIDSPAVGWGVQIDRVEIKDVSLPETMKRSMARQAEADRERRARVINADAELQASKKLAQAAQQMSTQPAALQLRLLQTVVAVAAEKNSTLVLPFPVELLRFLERAQQGPPPSVAAGQPQEGSGGSAPERPADVREPAVPQEPAQPSDADPASPMDPDVVDPAVTAQTFTDQPLPDAPLPDTDTGPDGKLPGTDPDGVPEFDPETVPEFEPEPSGHRRSNPFAHQ
ncbi:slipin family protein [Streptomyces sp. wa22]|uniref:slipin family protein n=1 Tax=Streptomyces sp. wa22 TaxID=1828244 RepID=UPI0011C93F81|nr:slipin family protein [Streptomyces sp. wa22]TXS09634.1 slipin family protein [Streptomyces sp. wa22]